MMLLCRNFFCIFSQYILDILSSQLNLKGDLPKVIERWSPKVCLFSIEVNFKGSCYQKVQTFFCSNMQTGYRKKLLHSWSLWCFFLAFLWIYHWLLDQQKDNQIYYRSQTSDGKVITAFFSSKVLFITCPFQA